MYREYYDQLPTDSNIGFTLNTDTILSAYYDLLLKILNIEDSENNNIQRIHRVCTSIYFMDLSIRDNVNRFNSRISRNLENIVTLDERFRNWNPVAGGTYSVIRDDNLKVVDQQLKNIERISSLFIDHLIHVNYDIKLWIDFELLRPMITELVDSPHLKDPLIEPAFILLQGEPIIDRELIFFNQLVEKIESSTKDSIIKEGISSIYGFTTPFFISVATLIKIFSKLILSTTNYMLIKKLIVDFLINVHVNYSLALDSIEVQLEMIQSSRTMLGLMLEQCTQLIIMYKNRLSFLNVLANSNQPVEEDLLNIYIKHNQLEIIRLQDLIRKYILKLPVLERPTIPIYVSQENKSEYIQLLERELYIANVQNNQSMAIAIQELIEENTPRQLMFLTEEESTNELMQLAGESVVSNLRLELDDDDAELFIVT